MTEVRKDLGVFVDTGLLIRKLLYRWIFYLSWRSFGPKKGDKLYVRLSVDKKDRIWANLAYQEDFQRFGSSGL